MTEGCQACGEVFTGLVEHVTSPSWPYQVLSPHWDALTARLALTVLCPAPPPAPPAEPEDDFLVRLGRARAGAGARLAAGGPRRSSLPPPAPPEPEPDPRKPDLSKPGTLSESLRAMGLV